MIFNPLTAGPSSIFRRSQGKVAKLSDSCHVGWLELGVFWGRTYGFDQLNGLLLSEAVADDQLDDWIVPLVPHKALLRFALILNQCS